VANADLAERDQDLVGADARFVDVGDLCNAGLRKYQCSHERPPALVSAERHATIDCIELQVPEIQRIRTSP
jgi:hypothetical protein